MDTISIFLIAVGLAMDAFAVSVSNGIAVCDFRKRHALKVGVYFGFFQFIMPVIGYLLGTSVKAYIEAVDHWIAFILLIVIGGNMVLESFHKEEDIVCSKTARDVLTVKKLVVQAVATSIDALAVGISFAILDINILYAASIIGIVALFISFAGGNLGKSIGSVLKERAEFLGGAILIVIGIKILIEHLFLAA